MPCMSVPEPKRKYDRIKRSCPYCSRVYVNLPRHLRSVHRKELKVQEAENSDDSRRAFAVLRNEGILKFNKNQEDTKLFQVIKKTCGGNRDKVVHCKTCNGAYSSKYFHRHMKKCKQVDKPVVATSLVVEDAGFAKILGCLQNSDVREMCHKDKTLRYIGEHLFQKDKAKVDKKSETKRSVMTDIRTLAKVYQEFRSLKKSNLSTELDIQEMFQRENFEILSEAILHHTSTPDGKLKYGLKNNLYYMLQRASRILEGRALTTVGADKMAKEMRHFQKVLKHNENLLFADSKYAINMARQERLRLPNRVPPDEAVGKLRNYAVTRIQAICELPREDLDKNLFIELRNLTCSRLTLFNARRGGEPARMKICHWTNRGQWLQSRKTNCTDMAITYAPGKGNHLVDTIVPRECMKALEALTDADIRKRATVAESNIYIFANTELSDTHCSGWNCTKYVQEAASIECPELNATGLRIKMSTMYAALDVPNDADRQLFYKHLGHTELVNKGTYQRPLAEQTLSRIGQVLSEVDERASGGE